MTGRNFTLPDRERRIQTLKAILDIPMYDQTDDPITPAERRLTRNLLNRSVKDYLKALDTAMKDEAKPHYSGFPQLTGPDPLLERKRLDAEEQESKPAG